MTTVEIPPGITSIHFESLKVRGFTIETIVSAGLKSVTADDIKTILGFNPPPGPEARRLGLSGSPGIGIPFFDLLNGRLRLTRFRLDYPAEINGKPAKYLSPKGAGNILYFPPDCGEKLSDNSIPLIITEGEFKVLAAHQAGLFAVGLIGVWGWKTRVGSNLLSSVIADFDLINFNGRKIIIVYDSDAATNPSVEKARHALEFELYHRGAGRVYLIDLPVDEEERPMSQMQKVGLDDFILKYGIDAFHNLDLREFPPPISFSVSAPEFMAGEDEPLEWGIEGILPLGSSGFIISSPKTGKSFLMLYMAYCLTTGAPFLDKFRVPRKRKVLIIEEEDSKRRTRRRLRRIINSTVRKHIPDDLYLSVKTGFKIDDPLWINQIERELERFRPDVVFIDVFNRVHLSDINNARDMARIVDTLDELIRKYNVTFLILHHDRKSQAGRWASDNFDKIMGSRVLGGFSETTIFLTPLKEKGLIKVKLVLKDEPEGAKFIPEFLIKLTNTLGGAGTYFEFLGVPKEKQVTVELREKIKNFVLGQDEPVTAKQVGDGVGCSKPTARENLNTLADLKLIGRIIGGRTHLFCSLEMMENLK